MKRLFSRIASATSRGAGSARASLCAAGAVVIWAATGPWFHYSETWQLVINTGTTIVTFLMVFLIQHSQNCDSSAVHIKLDEIIATLKHTDKTVLDLEQADVEELDELKSSYCALAAKARKDGQDAQDHAAAHT